jgi:hypothetical protein
MHANSAHKPLPVGETGGSKAQVGLGGTVLAFAALLSTVCWANPNYDASAQRRSFPEEIPWYANLL